MFEREVSLVTRSRREDGRLLKDKADKFIDAFTKCRVERGMVRYVWYDRGFPAFPFSFWFRTEEEGQ